MGAVLTFRSGVAEEMETQLCVIVRYFSWMCGIAALMTLHGLVAVATDGWVRQEQGLRSFSVAFGGATPAVIPADTLS